MRAPRHPFATVDELQSRGVVGAKTLDKLLLPPGGGRLTCPRATWLAVGFATAPAALFPCSGVFRSACQRDRPGRGGRDRLPGRRHVNPGSAMIAVLARRPVRVLWRSPSPVNSRS